MSFPVFGDIDKSISDLLKDDFDTKCFVKVKTAGPWGSTVTTNTALDCKAKTTNTKLSVKYPHASGFTLEKLEITSDGHLVTETSLTGTAPGLKIEFKGDDDKTKGDLIATYVAPQVTLATELDVLGLNKLKASATSGNGPVTAGASAVVNLGKTSVEDINIAVGYAAPQFYGVVKAKDFKDFTGLVSYSVNNKLNVAAQVNHGEKGVTGAAAAIYACCPSNTVKFKVGSDGAITAAVKRSYPGKFVVVANATTNANAFSDFKWGVNATLG